MLEQQPTHIIEYGQMPTREDEPPKAAELLFRFSDGMLIADRIGNLVRFGEDPKETRHRRFLNEQAAQIFLRNLPRLFQNEIDPPPQPKDFKTPNDFQNAQVSWSSRQPNFVIEIRMQGLLDSQGKTPIQRVSVN